MVVREGRSPSGASCYTYDVRWVGRVAAAIGVTGIVAGIVIGFWPLHANGVSGSAVRPHYAGTFYFGFYASASMPDNPTTADLRRAGVRFPVDVVRDRRQVMYDVLGGAVLVAVGGAAVLTARSRRTATGY